MANPNAIVSRFVTAARPAELGAAPAFELEDGRALRLDPDNPRSDGFARVLAGLAELRRPVYVEVDRQTEAVSRILIPHVGRVTELRDVPEGLEVQIDNSQGRHLLKRDRPDFAGMESALREANAHDSAIILTSDDAQMLEDVRPFRWGPEDGPAPDFLTHSGARQGIFDRIWWWPIWPWCWWRYRCVSSTRAQQIFDSMNATTCNPVAIAPPCIPFMFPDDGCWGRAHEMRRLMNNMGIDPKKIWIHGILHTPTRNNPNCFVNWGWHVAPTICVRRRWRWWYLFCWWWGERMVIDPSLFTTPVTEAQWKAVQGDPNATLDETSGSIFYFPSTTDPTYVQTDSVLAYYRLQLQNRVIQSGPPPYANCP
jgi:Glutaminase